MSPPPEEKSPDWELADDARRLIRAMKYTEAEAVLERCVQANPRSGECRSLYASVLATLGQTERAKDQYNIYISTQPTAQPHRPRSQTPLNAYGRPDEEER